MAKKTKKAAPQSRETAGIKSFLDMIAPSVVKFEPDHFICGNTFRCVWALREYPTQTDEQAILRHLGEKDGITLRIYTRQVTPAEEKRIIQNAANKNRMSSSNTNDLQQTITAESNLQDVASLVASMRAGDFLLYRRRYYAVGHHKAGLRPLCTDLYGPPAPQTAHQSNIVSCSRSHCAPGAFLRFRAFSPHCRSPPFSRFASPQNLEKTEDQYV